MFPMGRWLYWLYSVGAVLDQRAVPQGLHAKSAPSLLAGPFFVLRITELRLPLNHVDDALRASVLQRLGVADAVADVVDTGATLRVAGLETIGEPIMHSEALLIRRTGAPASAEADVFIRRLQGVLTARTYVLVDYDIPKDRVADACALTPGLESPTVSPLAEDGWVAVRAVVPKTQVHRIMDRLADIGGRGILVTAISACRL